MEAFSTNEARKRLAAPPSLIQAFERLSLSLDAIIAVVGLDLVAVRAELAAMVFFG